MTELDLLIDLYKHLPRQGPGSSDATKMALQLAGMNEKSALTVADIGCGTGTATLMLANALNAKITAVDMMPSFLAELQNQAKQSGLSDDINTVKADMATLPFAEGQYDLLWSEGAIYHLGFEQGIKNWRKFLKPQGRLVVSEITWTTAKRPKEIETYWQDNYPHIDTASAKLAQLEQAGYQPLGYFVLPQSAWWENYYAPLQDSFAAFLARHEGSDDADQAQALVTASQEEIARYQAYHSYYSYGMYVAAKCE